MSGKNRSSNSTPQPPPNTDDQPRRETEDPPQTVKGWKEAQLRELLADRDTVNIRLGAGEEQLCDYGDRIGKLEHALAQREREAAKLREDITRLEDHQHTAIAQLRHDLDAGIITPTAFKEAMDSIRAAMQAAVQRSLLPSEQQQQQQQQLEQERAAEDERRAEERRQLAEQEAQLQAQQRDLDARKAQLGGGQPSTSSSLPPAPDKDFRAGGHGGSRAPNRQDNPRQRSRSPPPPRDNRRDRGPTYSELLDYYKKHSAK